MQATTVSREMLVLLQLFDGSSACKECSVGIEVVPGRPTLLNLFGGCRVGSGVVPGPLRLL